MGKASEPDIRITAMAPMPWGVAIAQMVSLFKILVFIALTEHRGLMTQIAVLSFNIMLEGQIVCTVLASRSEILSC